MEFPDELFKLGMRVKEVDGWKELMSEVFRSNIRDDKLRYHLLSNTHKGATFTELRVDAQEFEYRYGGIKYIDNECYRIEQVDTDTLRKELLDLKKGVEWYKSRKRGKNYNSGSRGVKTVVQRCYNCGGVGHLARCQ